MAENDTTTTGTTTVTSSTPYFDPTSEITQDEYQTRFIDFYNMPTITDPVVIDDDDDDDDDQDVQPNVLAPVKSDNDRQTIFGQGTVLGEGESFTFETLDYNKVINDYVDPSKAIQDGAKKEKSFSEFGKAIADMYKTPEGAIGSGVGFMMGLGPLGGPALSAMAQLNRKKQKETADAISATGGTGGAMFTLNGQTVYRAPGSTQYSGTYEGSSSQLLGMEAITNGFLPGTFKEVLKSQKFQNVITNTNEYVKTGLAVAHADPKAMVVINANGNTVGSDGSMGSVSASQATMARENHAKKLAAGTGYTPTAANALEIRQKGLAHMKATFNIGMFDRTSDLSPEESAKRAAEYNRYTSTLMKQIIQRQRKVSDDFSTGELGTDIGIGSEVPQDSSRPDTDSSRPDTDSGSSASDDKQSDKQGGGSGPADTSSGSSGLGGGSGGPGDRGLGGQSGGPRALGGRVGYAPGGVARAAPAGFVERPPSQVSEAATVADDKPMSVPEGTFVINAAAVEFAGEKDIMEMLNVAYKKAEKKGIQPPSEEMLEVAVSRGEVIVPAFLAKIIGYDRLEKINNRGKKEVNQRIKENGQRPVGAAGGGFLTRKKLANGGEVDEYEDKIIADEVNRKMRELLESLPEDVTVTSKYFGDERPARREYYEELARLNEIKPIQGKYFSNDRTKLINAPQTPTLLNLYVLAEEVAHQLGNTTKQRPLGLIGVSEQERREYRESKYSEELRAKKIAFDAVGGLFPTDKRAVDLFEGTHANSFANYVLKTGSPEFLQQMLKKYPKLKGQIKEDGTLKKQTKPSQDFLIAVQEEEARIKDAFMDNTFVQRMNPLTDSPKFTSGYTGPEGNPSK